MKLLSQMSKQSLESLAPSRPTLCGYVSTPWGVTPMKEPKLSIEHSCEYCSGKGHYTPLVNPNDSDAKTWLCANPHCEVYKTTKGVVTTPNTTQRKRALEWPKFCEINGIGDLEHHVKFEDIDQSAAKVSYLLKFSVKPQGIILMRGDTGTGKSYCAMATCEIFTRKSTSAVFTTQKNLCYQWLEKFKNNDPLNNLIDKVTNYELLVIDDFGTGDIPPGFMGFFMDLLNTRMQWSNRGTIITTNLDSQTFDNYCGPALSDRILTGQIFEFKGKTKRKKTIL